MALVQELGTPPIFDIAPLRLTTYRRELIYREALEDQSAIAASLKATKEATGDRNSINSIVKLLGLTHAASVTAITDSDRESGMLRLILTELAAIKSEINSAKNRTLGSSLFEKSSSDDLPDLMSCRREFERLELNIGNLLDGSIPPTDFTDELKSLQARVTAIGLFNDSIWESDLAAALIAKVAILRTKHDAYLRSAKAEPDS